MASVVQMKAATHTGTCTLDAATSAGNKVVVLVWAYGATDIGTTDLSDDQSNTYTRRVVGGNGGVACHAAVFSGPDSPTAGAQVFTLSAHTDHGLAVYEVSGLGSAPFDGSAADHKVDNAPTTGNTATLAQADEMAFAVVCTDSGVNDTITPNAGQGWTQDAEAEDGTSTFCFNVVHKTVAATTALAASWALANTHDWACAIGTFKISGGTVPGAPTGLTLTPGSTQMGLSWTAPASDGGSALTDYTIQYRVHL